MEEGQVFHQEVRDFFLILKLNMYMHMFIHKEIFRIINSIHGARLFNYYQRDFFREASIDPISPKIETLRGSERGRHEDNERLRVLDGECPPLA